MNISEIFIRRPIGTSLVDGRHPGVRHRELSAVAGRGAADRGFPDHHGDGATLPGASPDTMASSVATPLEQQFAAIPGLAQMTSTSGLGTTSITLQFDLDRNIDGAAGDVQTAINAASGLLPKDLPNPPTYKKTNPADRPDPDLRGLLRRAADLSRRRLCLHDHGAAYLADHRRRRRSTLPASSNMRCTSRSTRRRSPRAGSASRTCTTRLPPRASTSRKAISKAPQQAVTLDTNDQLFNAESFRQRDRRLSQRRAGAGAGHRQGDRLRRVYRAQAPGTTASPPSSCWSAGRPAPIPSRWSIRSRRRCRCCGRRFPPSIHVDAGVGPIGEYPRFGQRCAVHPRC